MSGVHDARMVPAAASAWTAAALVLSGQGLLFGALAVGLAAAALVTVRWRRAAAASLALCTVVALAAAGVAHADLRGARCAAAELESAGPVLAAVEVGDEPRSLPGGGQRWIVDTTVERWARVSASGEGQHDGAATRCPQAAVASLAVVVAQPVVRGDRLTIEGTVSADERGGVIMWQARVQEVRSPAVLVQWRAAFARATEGLDPDVRGLVRGMITGDTSVMPDQQLSQMRTAGLAHLVAVSGAHFAILIAGVGAAVSSIRAPRAVRALVVLAVALGFGAIVGHEASVVRALTMASAVALGLAWGRPARGLPALAVGVLALVLVAPWVAGSLGFAMSVAAVVAIVLWAPVIAKTLSRWVAPTLARVAAVPIAAQAAVTPLVLVIEPGIPLYAVPANLIAGLAVPPVMAAGAAALVIAPVHHGVAALLAHGAGTAAMPIAWAAQTAAGAPGARLPWTDAPPGVLAAALVTALLVVATVAAGAVRWACAVVAIAAAVLSVLAAPGGHPAALEDWDVVACDVGQGDMMLVRAAPRSAIVIDTGPTEEAARACLVAHGVDDVPLLILTHPHADHDGGVAAVLASAHVEAAWIAATGVDGAAEVALAAHGVAIETPSPGQRAQAGGASVEVLSGRHEDPSAPANDASLVVVAQGDGARVLALGDLEEEGQRALLERLPALVSVDAVKVAHHGSARQLDELESRIHAQVAIVSAGADNRHGHPTAAALALYGDGRVVLRTDQCGSVAIARDADGLRWSQCPTDVAR